MFPSGVTVICPDPATDPTPLMDTFVALLTDHCRVTDSPRAMVDRLIEKLLIVGGFGAGCADTPTETAAVAEPPTPLAVMV